MPPHSIFPILLVVCLGCTGVAADPEIKLPPEKKAALAAVADGASTLSALSSGAVERNALLPTSPVGIIAVTAAKVGLTGWANQQPEPRRSESMKSMTAVFGGAAVNNLFVLAGAANPISWVAGLTAGVFFWNNMEQSLQEQALARASRQGESDALKQINNSSAQRWSCPKPKTIRAEPS